MNVKSSPTRFAGLGYTKAAPGLWRFVDTDTGAVIGEQYRTRGELLADMAEFAKVRGFEVEATK